MTQDSFGLIMQPADQALPPLSSKGITLLDCFKHLPHMRDFIRIQGIEHQTVRARLERKFLREDNVETSLTIHPDKQELLDEILAGILVSANAMEDFTYTELRSGGVVKMRDRVGYPPGPVTFPDGVVWNTDELRLWPTRIPLNEFGFFYVSLFILSNLARYYPDLWLREIERSTPIVQAVEELLRGVEERMVLLSLSEMERRLFVVER